MGFLYCMDESLQVPVGYVSTPVRCQPLPVTLTFDVVESLSHISCFLFMCIKFYDPNLNY